MLVELRSKSQLTLPKQVVLEAGLSEGDKIEISVKDGVIHMMPVAVYPKAYVDKLQEEVETLRERLKAGNQNSFSNVDDLLDDLEA